MPKDQSQSERICPMTDRVCINAQTCGVDETECYAFELFGMTCDECERIGHREAGGWALQPDGRVVCEGGCSDKALAKVKVAPSSPL